MLHATSPSFRSRRPGSSSVRPAAAKPAWSSTWSTDSQVQPKLEQFDYTLGRRVRLFSDLRRHDMGPQLAERTDRGVAPSVFLTRPLWGLGDRGNYFLHDGRARSIAEAIRLHGGEAAEAAGSFAALPIEEQRAIEVFLLSLRRQPQGRILP